MNALSIRDISWFAGIMEGEGYFGVRKQGIVVQLDMTDKDVIDRVATLFRFGCRDARPLPSGKTVHRWRVVKQSAAAGLMMTLLPLMGERRHARIMRCLEAWKARRLPYRMVTHCKHGHALAGDNLRIITEGKYTKRRCRACAVLRQQKYASLRGTS